MEKRDQDLLIIEDFLLGKEGAFDILVKKYQDRILNIVYSIIGKDLESQDITQEIFLKVYNNLKYFRKKSKFSTWLYRITINTICDFLRKRRKFFDISYFDKGLASTPEEELMKKEDEEFLINLLSKIPLKYRTAFVLKEIDNLNYKEIAEILHCSIGTVESRIYRARQFLKNLLKCF